MSSRRFAYSVLCVYLLGNAYVALSGWMHDNDAVAVYGGVGTLEAVFMLSVYTLWIKAPYLYIVGIGGVVTVYMAMLMHLMTHAAGDIHVVVNCAYRLSTLALMISALVGLCVWIRESPE